MENENKWEEVSQNEVTQVSRHKVDGGYLYCVTIAGSKNFTVTFVPDVDLQRYQAHLRDAYNQGFKDGQDNKMAYTKKEVDEIVKTSEETVRLACEHLL